MRACQVSSHRKALNKKKKRGKQIQFEGEEAKKLLQSELYILYSDLPWIVSVWVVYRQDGI